MIISIKSEEDTDVQHMLYWVLIESGIGMLVGILFSYGIYKIKKMLGMPHFHDDENNSNIHKRDIEMGFVKETTEIGIMTEEPPEHKDPIIRNTPINVNLV